MSANQDRLADRRHWLRHKVNTPAFASFDGVTGGMVLDLSEGGMSMQTTGPVDVRRRVQVHLDLAEPSASLETTGYIAWADALGRAGVRFTDLPEEARDRLEQWLTLNDSAPSQKAPKFTVGGSPLRFPGNRPQGSGSSASRSISLETEPDMGGGASAASTTIQYEFNSLGTDLNTALRQIGERARSLTRGTGAAIALMHNCNLICRASIGTGAPALGAQLDMSRGFSAECVRSGRAMRCDDSEVDERVNLESCRRLGIRSIVASPVQYEREAIGLLEVLSSSSFAFDEGDVAVVQRLSQTVLLILSETSALPHT